MKKIFKNIPKILFAIICYLSALSLAILSAYFTIIFYSESQKGYNMLAMGGLAGMLEFIKIMLAVAFPFLQYRDLKREKKVLFYLRICFFLSIMASLNFFLTGGDIERSPASNITNLLYTYIPILEIIPISFSQFATTMSLSILVEAFIIFLPILAPIMFLEKDYKRKRKDVATTNLEKIKEIVTIIPERLIDRVYQKIVGPTQSYAGNNNLQIEDSDEDIKVIKINERPKLKLLKQEFTTCNDKDIENKKDEKSTNQQESNKNNTNGTKSKFVTANDIERNNDNNYSFVGKKQYPLVIASDMEIIKNAMIHYSDEMKIPSVNALTELTGLSKLLIQSAKKQLIDEKFIYTVGNSTFLHERRGNEKIQN